MALKLSYVTNGFRDHRLEDVFEILADLGYRGVALTLDVGHLHPWHSSREDVQRVRDGLEAKGLEVVIETGARYLLDPRRKHWPTLIGFDRRRERLDFLLRALEIAAALNARALSFWSGAHDKRVELEKTWAWLIDGIRALETAAAGTGVDLAFEPEPVMFIASLDDFRELRDRYGDGELRMTMDVGHLQCTEKPPHDRWIREFAPILSNVHVDDIRDRVHDHLALGEGEIDFPPLLHALEDVGYEGLASVELARHSHAAPEVAKESIEFLRAAARRR